MDIVTAVVTRVRATGLVIDEPVFLRSTNNVVVWLAPSAVVAKISVRFDQAAQELAVGRALQRGGAPVVGPAPGLGARVHRIGDHVVTFWAHGPEEDGPAPDARSVADTLGVLHRTLQTLGRDGPRPTTTYAGPLRHALAVLERPGQLGALTDADRHLLHQTLSRGLASLARSAGDDPVIHGSPHRLNILVTNGSPRFIDFETVTHGPYEWDLAHLEPAVTDHYRGPLDADVLSLCRLLVSAATATWCAEAVHRGPDMGDHAAFHLSVVRATVG